MEEGVVTAQGSQRLRRERPELLTSETLPGLVRDVVSALREGLLGLDRRSTEVRSPGGAAGQAK
jgi:hypothetical protein